MHKSGERAFFWPGDDVQSAGTEVVSNDSYSLGIAIPPPAPAHEKSARSRNASYRPSPKSGKKGRRKSSVRVAPAVEIEPDHLDGAVDETGGTPRSGKKKKGKPEKKGRRNADKSASPKKSKASKSR